MWVHGTQFIGISNFTEAGQAEKVLSHFAGPRLKLGVGVMMSFRTLAGSPVKKWPNRFPARDKIQSIFSHHPQAVNVAHYVSGQELDQLDAQLENVRRWCGKKLDGVQLDIAWPDAKAMRLFKGRWPTLMLILQVGPRAMMEMGDDARAIAKRVQDDYGDVIDYVLLDGSGGAGIPLVPAEMIERINALRRAGFKKQIIAGGGLGPYTLDLLRPVVAHEPNISIDAEGALRSNQEASIDWDGRAIPYVIKAQEILAK